ncbi:MAG: DUF952 domain-containing protein [Bacteroidia bacterium]|nr:DUF952 domain-containing protein [Bacteroidia bacterium]
MIYHITNHALWTKALDDEFYKHPSLKTEGFIHCSTREQLQGTVQKHFPGQNELLVLLIVEKRIKDQLKWEGSDPANKFPHVYGKFHISIVEDVRTIMVSPGGEIELI